MSHHPHLFSLNTCAVTVSTAIPSSYSNCTSRCSPDSNVTKLSLQVAGSTSRPAPSSALRRTKNAIPRDVAAVDTRTDCRRRPPVTEVLWESVTVTAGEGCGKWGEVSDAQISHVRIFCFTILTRAKRTQFCVLVPLPLPHNPFSTSRFCFPLQPQLPSRPACGQGLACLRSVRWYIQ